MTAFVWVGREVVARWRWDDAGVFERWAAAFSIGAVLWLATVWAAALLQTLNRPAMFVRTAVVVLVAIALRVTAKGGPSPGAAQESPFAPRGGEKVAEGRMRGPFFVLLLPATWIAFIAWRVTLLPPLSHDALAYHLPRALLWIRNGGYRFLDLPVDARMRILPANYEMLLADTILLGRSDAFTEWIAVFFYIAFIVACGALAERWFPGNSSAALATLMLSASVPVLLLHTGADKNDVMMAFLMASALLWAGRWLSARDGRVLALCVVVLTAAIGTKPQGLMLAACLAPVTVWPLIRPRVDWRLFAKTALVTIVAVALLGGATYLSRWRSARVEPQFVAYDAWPNLFRAPWILLSAPFSPSPFELFVPWADRPWFWRADELYFSHLGIPFVLAALGLPLAIRRFAGLAPERRRERRAIALASLACLLLMLPVRDVPMPDGIYVVALPRYTLFIVPVVFTLAVAPLVSAFGAVFRTAMIIVAALFVVHALAAAVHDRFVPLGYLGYARTHRGTRLVAFDSGRAAIVLDRFAGENDCVAMDAGYGAWIQPAFGAALRRPVEFIAPGGAIPSNAEWVMIDRAWRITWQDPGFRDLSVWRDHMNRGQPSAEDVRLLNLLMNDPRFELVYHRKRDNQAIFRRRDVP